MPRRLRQRPDELAGAGRAVLGGGLAGGRATRALRTEDDFVGALNARDQVRRPGRGVGRDAHHRLEEIGAAVGIVTGAGVLLTIFTIGLSDAAALANDAEIVGDAAVVASEFAVEVSVEVEAAIEAELVPMLEAAAADLPEIEAAEAELEQTVTAMERVEVREPVGARSGGSGGRGGGGGGGGRPPTGGEPPQDPPSGDKQFPGDDKFTPEEKRIADRLRAEGKDVEHIYNDLGEPTADAMVDGKPVEFKTLNPNAKSNTLNGAIQSATRQSGDVIIDAEGSGLSGAEARLSLERFLGGPRAGRLDSIRIFGNGFEITWP